jgi:hypothetical protein
LVSAEDSLRTTGDWIKLHNDKLTIIIIIIGGGGGSSSSSSGSNSSIVAVVVVEAERTNQG